ncbi:MAG: signal peptidase II [Candidatus Omnitrophota bacterium]
MDSETNTASARFFPQVHSCSGTPPHDSSGGALSRSEKKDSTGVSQWGFKHSVKMLTWAIALAVVVLDQVSKFLVLRYLISNESVEIVKNFFYLSLVCNTGAAFGMLKSQTHIFIFISTAAIISIVLYFKRATKVALLSNVGLSLILGGALGNLIDRLRYGSVIDFLDFRVWPVFNIADCAITIGVLFLVIHNIILKSASRNGETRT